MGDANIQATVTPLIQPGTLSPLQLSSPPTLLAQSQRLGTVLASQLATDLQGIGTQINALNTSAKVPPKITQLLLTNKQGQVTAAFGPVIYQGIPYTNYLSEIHVGNPLGTRDPNQALFNANTDGSVTIGQNGWLDIHDPFGGNAAWIGTRIDTWPVTNAYNNGSGLIRLTVMGQNFVTNNSAQVRNIQLYGVPNGLGTWPVTVIDANTVDLQGSVWSGAFSAPATPPDGIDTFSPTIDRVLQIIGAISSAGLIALETQIPHLYESGDRINVPMVPGVPPATGQWTIKVVDATHFTLDDSVFSGAWSANGTCLRYFAGGLFQTIAIGPDFINYKLRAFADGSLRIRNASITLTSAGGSIVLDPTIPSIDLTSPTGEIVLNAATSQIVLTTTSNLAKIIIDAGAPSIKMFDATGTLSVTIDSNGTVTAGVITSQNGISVVATVRNAAGTGISTLTFTSGILTAYTP